MALSMNSVGIPGGFRGNAGFSGKSGDLGPQKAFAQMAMPNHLGYIQGLGIRDALVGPSLSVIS